MGAGNRPAATATAAATTAPTAQPSGWARRADRGALAAFIADTTAATQRDASDFAAWLALAEAHAFMADSTLALGWGDANTAAEHFARAQAAALGALSARDQALAGEAQAQAALRSALTQETAAALYWYAKSLHARAKLIDHVERIAAEPFVAAAARACAGAAASIDHGGAYRLLGELAAHPADAAARDLASARAHLERALSVDASHADNALAYAEHFALPAQDRALFESMIARAAQPTSDTPENALARARALGLQAQIEERFE